MKCQFLSTQQSAPPCNHEEIIAELTRKNTKLEKVNQELQLFNDEFQKENRELRDKFEELFTELSIKEAQWCEREEQLNLKVNLIMTICHNKRFLFNKIVVLSMRELINVPMIPNISTRISPLIPANMTCETGSPGLLLLLLLISKPRKDEFIEFESQWR